MTPRFYIKRLSPKFFEVIAQGYGRVHVKGDAGTEAGRRELLEAIAKHRPFDLITNHVAAVIEQLAEPSIGSAGPWHPTLRTGQTPEGWVSGTLATPGISGPHAITIWGMA